jgi:hypothetical protein
MMPPKRASRHGEVAWTIACVVLGAFMVAHGVRQASAVGCPAVCASLGRAPHRPAALAIVAWMIVVAPLVAYAAAAAGDALSSRARTPGTARRQTFRTLTTATCVGALVFVVLHALQLQTVALRTHADAAAIHTQITADLSSTTSGIPLYALLYLVGSACACFFVFAALAAPVAGRLAKAPSALRRLPLAGIALSGVVLWACFANVVIAYATGKALVGGSASVEGAGRCP